jgi:hypothetical protein
MRGAVRLVTRQHEQARRRSDPGDLARGRARIHSQLGKCCAGRQVDDTDSRRFVNRRERPVARDDDPRAFDRREACLQSARDHDPRVPEPHLR